MSCLELLEADDELSQGDVIMWSEASDCMGKAAVVVTADCDLAKRKHWGRVTVVPLIPATDYFDKIYLPKQLESLEGELFKIFGRAIQKIMGHAGSSDGPPTELALDTLLGLDALPEPFSKSDDAVGLHFVIRQARGVVAIENAANTLDRALLLRNDKTKALSMSKVQTFLDNPPGDCMVLPPMDGLEPVIHIAFLRALRGLPDENIALKTSQKDPNKGQRIGRLIPVVRYRLTQMLAQVFSDIGLPDSYEAGLGTEKTKFLATLVPTKESVE